MGAGQPPRQTLSPQLRAQVELRAKAELRATAELRALPGLLHSLGLLPLAHEALVGTVERALADNPMLQRLPGSPCPACGRHRSSGAGCPRCSGTTHHPAPDPTVSPFETLEAAAGWEIRSDCRHALPIVIAHLTGRGLLAADPAKIAAAHGIAEHAVAEALRAIQAVGPVGIAERTVSDLLLSQARVVVAAGQASTWFVDLVRDHLAAVAADDAAVAAAALAVPEDAVAEAFEMVRTRLRPLPLVEHQERDEALPAPDVFVYRSRSGAMEVDVADSQWFGLRVSRVPPDVRADAEAAAWLAEHERAARDLLHQLDTRAGVLRRVSTYAVQQQSGFFERGAAGHVPLTRTDVAAELGLHPSTVSRSVAGKILRCPPGGDDPPGRPLRWRGGDQGPDNRAHDDAPDERRPAESGAGR